LRPLLELKSKLATLTRNHFSTSWTSFVYNTIL